MLGLRRNSFEFNPASTVLWDLWQDVDEYVSLGHLVSVSSSLGFRVVWKTIEDLQN